MQLTEAIQGFSNYLKFEKRYSQHTIRAYTDDLSNLAEFLRSQFQAEDAAEISTSFLRTWLALQKDEGKLSRTINRKISSVKSFFKYLQRQKIVELNPATALQAQKNSKRLPQFIEKNDLDTLWENIVFTDDWQGKTSKLIFQLFYQTGIRLSELINLKESHINNANSTIKILGKGNKERLIPCDNQLIQSLLAYKQDKRIVIENYDAQYLLVNNAGKKLYAKWVYNTVHHYLNGVTTLAKRSPHVLRHTFATHLMNEGAELQAVKELLGHSSLAATQVYTHNTIEKLKAVYQLAHPKA